MWRELLSANGDVKKIGRGQAKVILQYVCVCVFFCVA